MVPTVSALERFHCIYEREVVEIFSYEHLKRFSNGKMLNFLRQGLHKEIDFEHGCFPCT